MAFSWTNINSRYANQKIAFSKDGERTFTDIDFTQGVWDYKDINDYIKDKTKTVDGEGNKEIIANEVNIGKKTPNLSEDTDVLNIHCDLISDS